MRGVRIGTRVTSEVCAENVKVNRNIIRTYLSEIGISQSPEYTRTEISQSPEEFRKGRVRSVTGVRNGVRIVDPNTPKWTTTWAGYPTRDRNGLGDGDSCGKDGEELTDEPHFGLLIQLA